MGRQTVPHGGRQGKRRAPAVCGQSRGLALLALLALLARPVALDARMTAQDAEPAPPAAEPALVAVPQSAAPPPADPPPADPPPADPPPDSQAGEMTLAMESDAAYAPVLEGLDGEAFQALQENLIQASHLFSLKDRPPASLVGLERRASTDNERLKTVLRAAGYYHSTISITLDPQTRPYPVRVSVTPGVRYRFQDSRIAVEPEDGLPAGIVPAPADLGLVDDQPAQAQQVREAEERLVRHLNEQGYAYARIVRRQVVADHDKAALLVTLTVEPGPPVRFGPVRIQGLEAVEPSLVEGRLPWREGEAYHPGELETARERIGALGVFDEVRVRLGERSGETPAAGWKPESAPAGPTQERSGPEAEHAAPVEISVHERKRRFVGASVSLSTTDGLAAGAYWGHRNLFGGGERLQLAAEVGRVTRKKLVGENDLELSAEFRKPDFLALRQTLVLAGLVVEEKPAAYTRDAAIASIRLERVLQEGVLAGGGLLLEQSRITDADGPGHNSLAGVPLSLSLDATDDPLDPHNGFRSSLELTPYFQTGDENNAFVSGRLTQTGYLDLSGDGRYVLAGRFSLGAVLDQETRQIPADKRFYAGGGGSIRGYGYQKVGPRDAWGEPRGGRSLVEVGAELRIKVSETVGLVPFLDGGNVYASTVPSFSQPLRWGAGMGVRYYSDLGPLRLDVGLPLNRQTGDSPWELYLSLGQAF